MLSTRLILPLLAALLVGGCTHSPIPYIPRPGIPFVHKIDVQQGNVVTQEMVAQLRLGMNKKKVRFVMGTPIIQDTFHSSRWDYIYTFHEGGGGTERRRITTVFNEDGKLIALEGGIKAALGRLEVDRHQDTSVQVPGEYQKSFLGRIADSMPFTGDDAEPVEATDETKDKQGDDSYTALPDDESDDDVLDEDADADELIADANATSVTVPEGAPPKKKKGFFSRIIDSVGLGADEDEDEDEDDGVNQDDRRYRDPTDPDNINRPY
jgi:outer membrane protein assembly factor BamE (lipoprotein component of BamABCDE complex)